MTTTNEILAAGQRHGPVEVDRIQRAIALASDVHRGTLRRNGDPYIVHPLAVAGIVAELGADPDTIVAALLHDVVDDTDYPQSRSVSWFGCGSRILFGVLVSEMAAELR